MHDINTFSSNSVLQVYKVAFFTYLDFESIFGDFFENYKAISAQGLSFKRRAADVLSENSCLRPALEHIRGCRKGACLKTLLLLFKFANKDAFTIFFSITGKACGPK